MTLELHHHMEQLDQDQVDGLLVEAEEDNTTVDQGGAPDAGGGGAGGPNSPPVAGGGQDGMGSWWVVVEDLPTPSLDPLHPVVVVVEFLL